MKLMRHINIQYYKTKIGELILGSFDSKLCMLDFRYRKMRATVDNRIKKGLDAEFIERDDEIIGNTLSQLDEYLRGGRKIFDLPLLMVGTVFQKNVWNALMKLPYGTTSTYLQLAQKTHNEKSFRAVANANGANSIAIIIPCHRIIGSSGELVGYGGGLPVKKRLLKLEKKHSDLTDNEKYDFIGNNYTMYDGVFITAVKTTGIYCLPSCKVKKPKRENAIFYNTKEEAIENGYRACKVCKP